MPVGMLTSIAECESEMWLCSHFQLPAAECSRRQQMVHHPVETHDCAPGSRLQHDPALAVVDIRGMNQRTALSKTNGHETSLCLSFQWAKCVLKIKNVKSEHCYMCDLKLFNLLCIFPSVKWEEHLLQRIIRKTVWDKGMLWQWHTVMLYKYLLLLCVVWTLTWIDRIMQK